MANIFADGVEINIEEGHWRLYNLEGANSLSPFFDSVRGKGTISYVAAFAEARKLPGTVLGSDYVRAAVAGFDEKRNRWLLGLHVQMDAMEAPRFIQLVQWPVGDDEQNGAVCQQAGRVLAEYIGCPLKFIGPKKMPLSRPDGAQRGATGILETRKPTDTLEKHRVQFKAELLDLPISRNGIWVGGTRNSLMLKVSKEADQGIAQQETPKYKQVAIEKDGKIVRLIQQSGLLGALAAQERVIKGDAVSNVELRHTVIHTSSIEKDEEGYDVDASNAHHIYGVYFTLLNESILVAQLAHTKKGVMVMHRVKTGVNAVGKDSYDPGKEVAFLRFHQEDQAKHDSKAEFAEAVAVLLASALNRSVLKTEFADQPE